MVLPDHCVWVGIVGRPRSRESEGRGCQCQDSTGWEPEGGAGLKTKSEMVAGVT